jgi:hypothetical protein
MTEAQKRLLEYYSNKAKVDIDLVIEWFKQKKVTITEIKNGIL